MRIHTKSAMPLVIAIMAMVLATSCSREKPTPVPQVASTAPAPQRSVVRVGYLRILSGAPLYTAVHEGYFREAGLDVQLRVIKSGPEGNEALAAGNLDVVFSILPSLVVARAQGVPADVVSIYGTSVDDAQVRDHRLMVLNDARIRRAIDLRGKKIGVVGWPGRTSDVLELLDYLQRHQLKPEDVTLVGMAHAEMASGLESRTIDAAAGAEPYITLAIRSGRERTLDADDDFYYPLEGQVEVTTYLARRGWIDANRATARAFVECLDRGRTKCEDRDWLTSQGLPSFNPDATPPIDFVRLTSEEAATLHLMPIKAQASVAGLRHAAELLVRHGPVKEMPTGFEAMLVDPRTLSP
jgi:ABC-type nitrate/sulfonate/bicarbonate transport system substrate-binding protein